MLRGMGWFGEVRGHDGDTENTGRGKAKSQEVGRGEERTVLCDTGSCVCVTTVGKIVVQGEDHHHHAFVCSVERPPMINVCHG